MSSVVQLTPTCDERGDTARKAEKTLVAKPKYRASQEDMIEIYNLTHGQYL